MGCSIPSGGHWNFAWGSDSLIAVAVPVLQAREHSWGTLLGLVCPAAARGFLVSVLWYSALSDSLKYWGPKLWPGPGTGAIFGDTGDMGKALRWAEWAGG